jgi:hypothetical protein
VEVEVTKNVNRKMNVNRRIYREQDGEPAGKDSGNEKG